MKKKLGCCGQERLLQYRLGCRQSPEWPLEGMAEVRKSLGGSRDAFRPCRTWSLHHRGSIFLKKQYTNCEYKWHSRVPRPWVGYMQMSRHPKASALLILGYICPWRVIVGKRGIIEDVKIISHGSDSLIWKAAVNRSEGGGWEEQGKERANTY